MLDATYLDTRIVLILHAVLYSEGRDVARGRAREADSHRVVILLVAFGRYGSVVLGLVGDVVLAVVGWSIVLVSVDAEDREVTRVAGPHPVVRITAELTYRSWRSEDETYVAEDIVGNEIVLVVGIVGAYLYTLVLALEALALSSLKALTDLLDLREALDFILGLLELSKDLLRDVTDRGEVAHGEPFDGELFREALRDKAVTEIVVVDGALRLDSVEAAVMVGEDKTLAGDSDPGTATTEDYNGVGHAGLVQVVKGVNGEAEAQFLHLSDVLSRELVEQPHPLISLCLVADREGGGRQHEPLL